MLLLLINVGFHGSFTNNNLGAKGSGVLYSIFLSIGIDVLCVKKGERERG